MKRLGQIVLAVAVGAAIGRWARRRVIIEASDSDRARQTGPSGDPVVDVWGDDSFPASDPPQSW